MLISVVIALYVALSALQQRLATGKTDYAVSGALIEIAAISVLLAIVLSYAGRLHRLAQTLLAVLGTQCLIAPLNLALFALNAGPTPDASGIVLLALIVVFVWNLLVLAHILRCALDKPLAVGMLLAVATFVMSIFINTVWFAPAGTVPGA